LLDLAGSYSEAAPGREGKPQNVAVHHSAVHPSPTLLCELRSVMGRRRFLFPIARSISRNMSDGAVNAAMARISYKDIITRNGFRHLARTMLGEFGWDPEALERQLSNKGPGVSGVYNKAQHLPERRKIMQEWADYLDQLRTSACVVQSD
jgi:hypothetical protein